MNLWKNLSVSLRLEKAKNGLEVVTHRINLNILCGIFWIKSLSFPPSVSFTILGYGKFLKSNPRYKSFLAAGANNEDAQLTTLQQSGYATDPKYAQKLKSVIKVLPKGGEAWSTLPYQFQSVTKIILIFGNPPIASLRSSDAARTSSIYFWDGASRSGVHWAKWITTAFCFAGIGCLTTLKGSI